jgi:hypothetical protein
MRKDDFCYYRTVSGKVKAKIKTLHADGSVTVEAMFFLRRDGSEVPGYLGQSHRIPAHRILKHA